ncbi:hypothetical protein QT381_10965 [Galbitalea sp. SE-J8]|uniref:hypothetical protein n=1 Tax=Galbitalea sp. SE-J8 TaxID=3054952 RepID=UPI00259CE9C1|nr:hypothetical protein [Galbitalea sp. SE-J8]MDM4763530.1 hypothetical protein [Galbitalea sp. SE-J8]
MTLTMTALFTGDSITDACRRTDPSGFLGAGYVRRVAEMSAASESRRTTRRCSSVFARSSSCGSS